MSKKPAKQQPTELSPAELDKVTGGDFNIGGAPSTSVGADSSIQVNSTTSSRQTVPSSFGTK